MRQPASGARRRRRRRGSARIHAARVQLHGGRHRPHGLVAYAITTTTDPAGGARNGTCPHSVRHDALHHAAEVGSDFGAARLRVLPLLPRRQDERWRGAARVLAVRRPHGRLAVVDLPGLHGESIAQVFFVTAAAFGASASTATRRRRISGWGSFLFMGVIGIIIAVAGQHLPAVECAAVRHLRDRRAGLRRPHRLRHAAHQGRLLRGDGERRDAIPPRAPSWARSTSTSTSSTCS